MLYDLFLTNALELRGYKIIFCCETFLSSVWTHPAVQNVPFPSTSRSIYAFHRHVTSCIWFQTFRFVASFGVQHGTEAGP